MNERISQLVSYSIEMVEVNGKLLPSYFDHMKFAKLVVLECMEELTRCPIQATDVIQDRVQLAEHLSRVFDVKM